MPTPEEVVHPALLCDGEVEKPICLLFTLPLQSWACRYVRLQQLVPPPFL